MTFSAAESHQAPVPGPVMSANFHMSIQPFTTILHLPLVLWNLWASFSLPDVVGQAPHADKISCSRMCKLY